MIGTLAEDADACRPTNYGFGEPMFQILILNATRRLRADRFYTDWAKGGRTRIRPKWRYVEAEGRQIVSKFARLPSASLTVSPKEEFVGGLTTHAARRAAPRLYRLIVAALETGCRLGELLSLRWEDVDLTRGEIRIRARHAKPRKLRYIPIVARLCAVLDMARHDPAGQPFGPDAHVFGDEVADA